MKTKYIRFLIVTQNSHHSQNTFLIKDWHPRDVKNSYSLVIRKKRQNAIKK